MGVQNDLVRGRRAHSLEKAEIDKFLHAFAEPIGAPFLKRCVCSAPSAMQQLSHGSADAIVEEPRFGGRLASSSSSRPNSGWRNRPYQGPVSYCTTSAPSSATIQDSLRSCGIRRSTQYVADRSGDGRVFDS